MTEIQELGTCDVAAERAILGGIHQYGQDAYFDTADILHYESFTVRENRVIYNCFKHIFETKQDALPDEAMIISASIELGYDKFFNSDQSLRHLRGVLNTKTSLENVRHFAAKVRKLHIARLLAEQCNLAIEDLYKLDGSESIDHILSIPEGRIFELNDKINNKDTQVSLLSKGLEEHLDYIESNPVDMVGISTGYIRYDKSIGGGHRRKEIDIIGARLKVGKTQLVDNIGMHISSKLGIPVMNIDTEMSREQHWYRILANLSNVPKELIETGKYGQDKELRLRVRAATKQLQAAPYFYECISGKAFEDVLATVRRWIHKEVGFDSNGKTKDCVLIYDYLKLVNDEAITRNMQEYQALGFMLMALKNFVIRYDIPCLSFMQLNRDGIEEESTAVASGSDRILMYCSSFSIFKPKSDEEIAEDGHNNGNRKLIPIVCRNGAGLDNGDYINMQFDGDFGRIKELKTRNELRLESKHNVDTGLSYDIGDSDIPFADEE